MSRLVFLVLSLALALPALPAAAKRAVDPGPVIAAERAFAADAAARGWVLAFRAFTAPDGVVLQPDPVNSADAYAAREDDGDKSLRWWPAYAGIARSGDLGFTTGPFAFGESDAIRGHYFTVWRRQRDGGWKWIFDAGVGVVDASPIARDAQPATLPVAARGAGREIAALQQVGELEGSFAERAAHDLVDPYRELLAQDARLNRAGAAPGVGHDAALAAAANHAPAIDFRKLGAAASRAGDLVFTFGEARWASDGEAKRGHYARIWQRRPEGWRIVFDEIIPRRS